MYVLEEGALRLALTERTDTGTEFVSRVDGQLCGAYRLAGYLLGNSAEAEDAVQEAIEKAWLNWPKLRDPDRFDAWFDRIVANVCKDRLRRRRRHDPQEIDDEVAGKLRGLDPFQVALSRDEVGRLVRDLPPDQQIVVALRFWRDLSLEAISERLDVPVGTVKSRLHYAIRSLRESLDRQSGEVER